MYSTLYHTYRNGCCCCRCCHRYCADTDNTFQLKFHLMIMICSVFRYLHAHTHTNAHQCLYMCKHLADGFACIKRCVQIFGEFHIFDKFVFAKETNETDAGNRAEKGNHLFIFLFLSLFGFVSSSLSPSLQFNLFERQIQKDRHYSCFFKCIYKRTQAIHNLIWWMNSIHTGKIRKPTETYSSLPCVHGINAFKHTWGLHMNAEQWWWWCCRAQRKYISYVFRLLLLPFLPLLMFNFPLLARS